MTVINTHSRACFVSKINLTKESSTIYIVKCARDGVLVTLRLRWLDSFRTFFTLPRFTFHSQTYAHTITVCTQTVYRGNVWGSIVSRTTEHTHPHMDWCTTWTRNHNAHRTRTGSWFAAWIIYGKSYMGIIHERPSPPPHMIIEWRSGRVGGLAVSASVEWNTMPMFRLNARGVRLVLCWDWCNYCFYWWGVKIGCFIEMMVKLDNAWRLEDVVRAKLGLLSHT